MKKAVLLIITTLAAASCIEIDFAEKTPVFSVSSSRVLLPADRDEGPGRVGDTLWITSNRTWTAAVEDTPDWISLGTDGHLGLSGVSEAVPLVIHCKDNQTNAARTARIRLSFGQGSSKTILVEQTAIIRRLVLVKGERHYDSLSPEGETLELGINTNCPWHIALAEGSTIKAGFSTQKGTTSSRILVDIAENFDMTTGLSGSIIISAEGCRDIEIPLSQSQGVPLFRLECDTQLQAPDGIGDLSIPIHCNVNWKADIASVSGFRQQDVRGTAGTRNDSVAEISFPYCISFGGAGEITVRFTADDVPGETLVTIRQNPCIRFSPGKPGSEALYTPGAAIGVNADNWPFLNPAYSEMSSSAGNATHVKEVFPLTLLNGYELRAYSDKGFWINSVQGFNFGGAPGNYLTLPSVEGHALSRIVYCFRGTSSLEGIVRNPEGKNVSDPFSTGGQGSVTTIPVSGAKPGEACTIYETNSTIFQIGEMTLYYE